MPLAGCGCIVQVSHHPPGEFDCLHRGKGGERPTFSAGTSPFSEKCYPIGIYRAQTTETSVPTIIKLPQFPAPKLTGCLFYKIPGLSSQKNHTFTVSSPICLNMGMSHTEHFRHRQCPTDGTGPFLWQWCYLLPQSLTAATY